MNLPISDERELALAISRELVQEHAPEEAEFFDRINQPDVETGLQATDDPFAFGVSEIVQSFSTVTLQLVMFAITFVLKKTLDVGEEVVTDLGKEWLKERLKPSPAPIVVLRQEQREVLRSDLITRAIEFGLTPEKAVQLTAQVLVRLGV